MTVPEENGSKLPRDVLFIASLDHSGSTMLDMLLGSQPNAIGIGEISLGIKRFKESEEKFLSVQCACGKLATECEFWGKVIPKYRDCELDLESGYRITFETFAEVFGQEAVLVDSSKYAFALEAAHQVSSASSNQINLRVARLLKDVRAFTVSQIDRSREKNNGRLKWFFAYKQFRAWLRRNKRLDGIVEEYEIPTVRIGYEEICFDLESALSVVCSFAGIQLDASRLSLRNSCSHILFGNRMRLEKETKGKIRYDARWLTRNEWLLPSLWYRGILKYNEENVYSNKISTRFKR